MDSTCGYLSFRFNFSLSVEAESGKKIWVNLNNYIGKKYITLKNASHFESIDLVVKPIYSVFIKDFMQNHEYLE